MAVSMIWLNDLLEYSDMAALITRYGCVNNIAVSMIWLHDSLAYTDMATLITRYGCVNDMAT